MTTRWLQLDDGAIVTEQEIGDLPRFRLHDVEEIDGHFPDDPHRILGRAGTGDLVTSRHLPAFGWFRGAGTTRPWRHAAVPGRKRFTSDEHAAHLWAAGAPELQWQTAAVAS